ncbi:hypothetical protein [Allostreptomyces psammosilenae]|uniref:SWIM-type domain-containing protein n=1 Tax=Allostreptomyces psammosilenae TaxID=1892865 RepID=A0A852ZSB0_9ACTN|nr:hypothetical protein [Allostreptomyces psammosilenae]NYI04160.1 hypothetical protein [Allostreptomyces psammosilenae]
MSTRSGMAVEDVRAAAGERAFRTGRGLWEQGAVLGAGAAYGGASADVRHGGQEWQVWVGVRSGRPVGECDCTGGELAETLCPHAVAVALAVADQEIEFRPLPEPEPAPARSGTAEEEMRAVAASLPHARLAELVARHAVRDRRLSTDLLAVAGALGVPDDAELAGVRRLVEEAAALVDDGGGGEPHRLAVAGRRIVEELRVLTVRPADSAVLDLVERAVSVWGGLAACLNDAWEVYEEEAAEIGGTLADVHLELCEHLRPDPVELGRRLAALEGGDHECCLGAPGPYTGLLGPEGLAAYRAALTRS